jgi:hypothetical protein
MNTHPEALRRPGGGLSRTLLGADTIMQQLPQEDKKGISGPQSWQFLKE